MDINNLAGMALGAMGGGDTKVGMVKMALNAVGVKDELVDSLLAEYQKVTVDGKVEVGEIVEALLPIAEKSGMLKDILGKVVEVMK
jgi:hypothetical protein